jgi:hypothetical protein
MYRFYRVLLQNLKINNIKAENAQAAKLTEGQNNRGQDSPMPLSCAERITTTNHFSLILKSQILDVALIDHCLVAL